MSLFVLGFWGSHAEGQSPIFGEFVSDYIVERAASLAGALPLNEAQLADINSISDGVAGYGGLEQYKSADAGLIVQDGAFVAANPVDVNWFDAVRNNNEVFQYIVQEGDALSLIAADFGVSTESIIWLNDLKNAHSLSLGQALKIPPVSGVVHVAREGENIAQIAKKYSASEEDIIAYNNLPAGGFFSPGTTLIVPDGKIQLAAPVAAAPTASGRPFSYLPDLDGYYFRPTVGTLSRGGAIHGRNGIDIANQCGTQIYAAADGTVRTVSLTGSTSRSANGGYGNFVVVVHPNGTETLYAHLLANSVHVAEGQLVAKGQIIAQIGGKPYSAGAGYSTGCHLHFEVHGARNPLAKY
ncbi:MAG TPA: peptidoglycan DD-metalloendopeptidase family protein [Candidatus Paceibacterota bacterium]|nr:peptidoglycan DD-metalloendopeptidase family protein [Candidatus Paceibacterota bacterium]